MKAESILKTLHRNQEILTGNFRLSSHDNKANIVIRLNEYTSEKSVNNVKDYINPVLPDGMEIEILSHSSFPYGLITDYERKLKFIYIYRRCSIKLSILGIL